jgi:transcription elongation factor GreA
VKTHDRVEIENLLEARLRELETDRIPRFEEELVLSGNEDPGVRALLDAARTERLDIRFALAEARTMHDGPWDQQLIEVGDAVEVCEIDSGEVDRYVLVPGGTRIRVDDGWISDRSPLGRAMVGARIGETVEVAAPGGCTRLVILNFERAGR